MTVHITVRLAWHDDGWNQLKLRVLKRLDSTNQI